MALGMVMQLPDQDDETSVSRRQLLAKLDVCMGGRVAEELIFGESNITTGKHLCWHLVVRHHRTAPPLLQHFVVVPSGNMQAVCLFAIAPSLTDATCKYCRDTEEYASCALLAMPVYIG